MLNIINERTRFICAQLCMCSTLLLYVDCIIWLKRWHKVNETIQCYSESASLNNFLFNIESINIACDNNWQIFDYQSIWQSQSSLIKKARQFQTLALNAFTSPGYFFLFVSRWVRQNKIPFKDAADMIPKDMKFCLNDWKLFMVCIKFDHIFPLPLPYNG